MRRVDFKQIVGHFLKSIVSVIVNKTSVDNGVNKRVC